MVFHFAFAVDLEKLTIRDSINQDSELREVSIPNRVSRRIVLLAIEFNGQFSFGTKKSKRYEPMGTSLLNEYPS